MNKKLRWHFAMATIPGLSPNSEKSVWLRNALEAEKLKFLEVWFYRQKTSFLWHILWNALPCSMIYEGILPPKVNFALDHIFCAEMGWVIGHVAQKGQKHPAVTPD